MIRRFLDWLAGHRARIYHERMGRVICAVDDLGEASAREIAVALAMPLRAVQVALDEWEQAGDLVARVERSRRVTRRLYRRHCSECDAGGWTCYGLGRGDPHFRECEKCGNPARHPCP